MKEAFYVPEAGRLRATEWTRGPWDPRHQHGGPPAALLHRAMEGLATLPGRTVRFTMELLRPVPISLMEVEAQVVSSGRSVERLKAVLRAEGKECCRAEALRIGTEEVGDSRQHPAAPLPRPEESAPFEFPFFSQPLGYHRAVEVRIAGGQFGSGAMAAWMRMKVALVAGEEPTPIERVLVAADAGNGLSAPLDFKRFMFINPDLSVHLHREPRTEWIGLEAMTQTEPDGIGLAQARLRDTTGLLGRSLQTLVVRSQRSGHLRA